MALIYDFEAVMNNVIYQQGSWMEMM